MDVLGRVLEVVLESTIRTGLFVCDRVQDFGFAHAQ